MTPRLLTAHHGALDWPWIIVPVVLALSWVGWAEARSRRRRGDQGPDTPSMIPDDRGEDGRA